PARPSSSVSRFPVSGSKRLIEKRLSVPVGCFEPESTTFRPLLQSPGRSFAAERTSSARDRPGVGPGKRRFRGIEIRLGLLERCVDAAEHDVVPRLQRSEEHTSELQSRENRVCRLLLEKQTSE